jgi:hypothetical protein
MTTTEEIVVSGKNFIERRIFVLPEQEEMGDVQRLAYSNGHRRGWICGFLTGLGLCGAAVLCIWLALRW